MTSTPAPRITVYLGARHDLYHTSRPLTGLCTLADRGELTLRYRVPRGDDAWLVSDPIVVCLDIETPVRRRVALDLRDGLGLSFVILERVEIYFKRAFDAAEVAALPPHLAAKVRRFGLNYGCRSNASTTRLLRAIGWDLLRLGRPGVARLRQYLSTPPPELFEQAPDAPVESKVMFQTRLWTADEVPAGEVGPLNESRVVMVRTLREAFGDRFVGGLVPTPLALSQYPEDVTPHPSRYRDYLLLKKRCLISVYTKGVEDSLAFKLGETIAASQCLVAVPLRFELPVSLVPGEHYLPFTTPEEAVSACRRLLDDPALAARMRQANHAYYRQHVEPATHLRNVIAQCV